MPHSSLPPLSHRAHPPVLLLLSGQGDWEFEFQESLVNLPASESGNDQNGHGVCKDTDGTIFFTFVPKKVTAATQVLAQWKPDGTGVTMLGKPGQVHTIRPCS